MACEHLRKNFRKFRFEKQGVTAYHKACQCLDCGQRVKSLAGGIWWPTEQGEKVSELPDFDLVLLDQCTREINDNRRQEYLEIRKTEALQKHEEYESYLQSAEWKTRRMNVLHRCGGICEACLQSKAVQVHHTNYDHIFSEVLWDLRGVCVDCHKKIHGLIK